MKKVILSALAVMAFGFAKAQEGHFKLGAHVGIPTGDIKDAFSVNLGADVAYMWTINNQFSAGALTGFTDYLGKTQRFAGIDIKWDDASFIPVGGTAQFSVTDKLFVGADLAYAIDVSKDSGDGGFLYQPKFGYQAPKFELYVSYKGISLDGATFSTVSFGANYKF